MLTVACVFVPSETYQPEHVLALRWQVERSLRRRHRFVCLTTELGKLPDAGILCRKLRHDWPGWWSKIELFRPDLFSGPVLYLDLDVIIRGALDELVQDVPGFIGCEDFIARGHYLNSSVMSWRGDFSEIYTRFAENPAEHMALWQRGPNCRIGDQAFIENTLHDLNRPFDCYRGGLVASYKISGRSAPPDARVVAFHGKPKMQDAPGWPQREWNQILQNL